MNRARRYFQFSPSLVLGVLTSTLLYSFLIAGAYGDEPPAERGALVPQPEMPGGPPRFVLDKRGPSGLTHGFAFSPDGNVLYTAGVDKSVEAWSLKRDPVQDDDEPGRLRLFQIRSIPWEISRGHRGAIYALDGSAEHIAIGGYSARQGGDVILIDRRLGEVEQSLPPERVADASNGHRQRLIGMSFSPDGSALLSVSEDGEIRLWEAPRWDSTIVRDAVPNFRSRLAPVRFITDDYFVIGDEDVFEIRARDTPAQVKFDLKESRPADVAAISNPSTEGLWCVAFADGDVELFQGAEEVYSLGVVRDDWIASDLSLSSDGQWLAIANLSEGPALELWDVGREEPRRVGQFDGSEQADIPRCRLSPDGRFLVSQHGLPGIFHLFDLEAAREAGADDLLENELYRVDVDKRDQLFTDIVFSQMREFDIDRKNYSILLSNDDGRLLQLALTPFGKLSPGDPEERDLAETEATKDSGGWEYTIQDAEDATGVSTIDLVNRRRSLKTRIVLDRRDQGLVEDYCWIPAPPEAESNEPVAIALGCRESHGVYVYRLPQRPNEDATIVRYFRDHQDDVLAVACSKDGRLLASSSRDQTLKFWSLANIGSGQPEQDLVWGGEFELVGNRLQVGEVTDGGIAAGRDLQAGDEITMLSSASVGREEVEARRMISLLRRHEPWEDLYVRWQRGQEVLERRITPAWEPIATLFVDQNLHWVSYTPEGFFKSSPFEGDELIHFLVNRGPGRPPKIVKAAQLRMNFDKSEGEFFDELLRERSTNGAFDVIGEPRVENGSSQLLDEIARLPEVRLRQPYLGEQIDFDEPLRVVADIYEPGRGGYEINEWRADLDGVPVVEPDQSVRTAYGRRIIWNNLPPEDCSQISRFRLKGLIRDETGAIDNRVHATGNVVFAPDVEHNPKYRIHLVLLACQEYDADGYYPPLRFPITDATSIEQLFRQPSPHYELGIVTRLFNKSATSRSVQKVIDELRSEIRRNRSRDNSARDLIFVFLGGHGDKNGEHFVFVTENVTNRTQELVELGIHWRDFEKFGDLQAPVIFLLDTCHSHRTITRSSVREFANDASMKEYFVLSATSDEQELANEQQALGHGFLTYFILEAARKSDGFDPNRDLHKGDVEWPEMIPYIMDGLPKFSANEQIPNFASSRTLENQRFAFPLFRPDALDSETAGSREN
ncbi:caspase family protein [Rubinisphaera margarita]|uniref:caspase family protein n=1 Tax=Rubinisphaera margarita TaxID=2909586 RepID=UPI001EE88A19|nr:caspase family protein [Rubinisphaera margarita]MCG6156050.1 caspase family protein [Rubinisphaera margarita]